MNAYKADVIRTVGESSLMVYLPSVNVPFL